MSEHEMISAAHNDNMIGAIQTMMVMMRSNATTVIIMLWLLKKHIRALDIEFRGTWGTYCSWASLVLHKDKKQTYPALVKVLTK